MRTPYIYRRFWAFEIGRNSVNGGVSDFEVPRVREWPMGLRIDFHIGRAQILIALLAYRPYFDPPHRL